MKWPHMDLCSGIFGFALAARIVFGDDHDLVVCSDVDPLSRAIQKREWPNAAYIHGLENLKGSNYARKIRILTAGFPCQPASIAGDKRGVDDDRWLWPEVIRIIRECLADWIVIENVRHLMSMEFNPSTVRVENEELDIKTSEGLLDSIVQDLEASGYSILTFIIPALAVDARHRRDRIWIVGYRPDAYGLDANTFGHGTSEISLVRPSELWDGIISDPGSEGPIFRGVSFDPGADYFPDAAREGWPNIEGRNPGEEIGGRNVAFRNGSPIPDANGSGRQEQRRILSGEPEVPAAEFCYRWSSEPGIPRVSDGVSAGMDGRRNRALGNAVVVPLVVQILSIIKQFHLTIKGESHD